MQEPIITSATSNPENYKFEYTLTYILGNLSSNATRTRHQLCEPHTTTKLYTPQAVQQLAHARLKAHPQLGVYMKNRPINITTFVSVRGLYYYAAFKPENEPLGSWNSLQTHVFLYNVKTKQIENLTPNEQTWRNEQQTEEHLNSYVPLNINWDAAVQNENYLDGELKSATNTNEPCFACSNKFRCARFKPQVKYGSMCKLSYELIGEPNLLQVTTEPSSWGGNQTAKLYTNKTPKNNFVCTEYNEYINEQIKPELDQLFKNKNETKKCKRVLNVTKRERTLAFENYIKNTRTPDPNTWEHRVIASFQVWCKNEQKRLNKIKRKNKPKQELVEPLPGAYGVKQEPLNPHFTPDDQWPKNAPSAPENLDLELGVELEQVHPWFKRILKTVFN